MEVGTINNMENIELIGDRILVRLDEAKDHTVINGIIIPVNTIVESESGKLKTELSKIRHLARGTILNISAHSAKKLDELNITLSPNDRVYVSHQAVNSSSYQWKSDRDKLISEFDGIVCVPHLLIEGKIITT